MIRLLTVLFITITLSACATTQLGSPCPDYGAYCNKTPINSWNYQEAN